jgi:hypothetical protein
MVGEICYQVIYENYRHYMKCSLELTRLDQFEKGRAYLQRRIESTLLGRIQKAKGPPHVRRF